MKNKEIKKVKLAIKVIAASINKICSDKSQKIDIDLLCKAMKYNRAITTESIVELNKTISIDEFVQLGQEINDLLVARDTKNRIIKKINKEKECIKKHEANIKQLKLFVNDTSM